VLICQLAARAVDMRSGIDGLSLHVRQVLGRPRCDGTAYVFVNRRRTRLKLVCRDGTGVWMCLRRAHHGHFTWPRAAVASQIASADSRIKALASIRPVNWPAHHVATSMSSTRPITNS
jgi:transposase